MIIQKIVKGLRYYPVSTHTRQALWERIRGEQPIRRGDFPEFIPTYELQTIASYVQSGENLPSSESFEEKALRVFADNIFKQGIICRWWEKVGSLPANEIPERLTDRNLHWHQNKYSDPDPLRKNQPFCEETPFISTTAGTIVRDHFGRTNILEPAKHTALRFATEWWSTSGIIAYAYVFTIGKKSIGHAQFAEEMRELNIYTSFSPYQPEGELTAKIQIPTTQIERVEIWNKTSFSSQIRRSYFDLNKPTEVLANPNYLPPDDYNNIRELL